MIPFFPWARKGAAMFIPGHERWSANAWRPRCRPWAGLGVVTLPNLPDDPDPGPEAVPHQLPGVKMELSLLTGKSNWPHRAF